ncbi:hypothetical protein BJX62DRAFT_242150 [Aspergillus germanicus]
MHTATRPPSHSRASSGHASSLNGTSLTNYQLQKTPTEITRELLAELPIMNPALTEYPPYDHYPSPPAQSTSDQPTEWTTLERDSWYYLLSEIALRRITDKICEHTVHNVPFDYFTTPSSLPTLLSLLPLTTELETQVRLWRDSLPTPMQFPEHPAPAVAEWRSGGVAVFLAEPFLCFAIHHTNNPTQSIPPVITTLAQRGLQNAVAYILMGRITHRHHGRWFQMRHLFLAVCLLLAAARAGIEMPEGWYAAVEKMYAVLDFWGTETSAFRAYRGSWRFWMRRG